MVKQLLHYVKIASLLSLFIFELPESQSNKANMMGCIILISKHLFLVPNFKINVIHRIYEENIINNIRVKKHFHNKKISEGISLASGPGLYESQ